MAYVIVFLDRPELENVIVEHALSAHEIVATFAVCGVRAVVTDETGAIVASSEPTKDRSIDPTPAEDDPAAPPELWWS